MSPGGHYEYHSRFPVIVGIYKIFTHVHFIHSDASRLFGENACLESCYRQS